MLQLFAKADARIDNDSVQVNSLSFEKIEPFPEERQDIFNHIIVMGGVLHGAGRTLHVHEHQAGAPRGHQGQEPGIVAAGADVVDAVGPGVHRHARPRHTDPAGIAVAGSRRPPSRRARILRR